MKKLLGLFFLVLLLTLSVFSFGNQPKAQAHDDEQEVEQCNHETTYTDSGDEDHSRVNINFQDNDDAITVTAKAGYQLVSVELDVDDDGHGGFFGYPVADGVKFNPNPGNDINQARVKVKKVCREVCNDDSALNYEAVVAGQTVANNNLCEYEEEKSHLACVNFACVKVEGDGENTCEVDADCQEAQPSPTPTQTPPNTGGPGDGRSDGQGCGSHDCSGNSGQVLGASTGPTKAVLGLSTTSGEENYLLQFAQLFGALTSAGLGLAFFKK